MLSFLEQYRDIFNYFLVFEVINVVICTICLYFIFKKAYIKGWLAFIPIVNVVYYAKICRLSWYWFFIPVINIVTFFVSPYILGYEFSQKEYIKSLGVLFPFLLFPYLAFTNQTYIHPKVSSLNLHNLKDIEKLENEIIKNTELENDDKLPIVEKKEKKKKIKNNETSNESKFNISINNLEQQLAVMENDDVIVDDVIPTAVATEEKKDTSKEMEIIDLYDTDVDVIEKMNDLNTIEEKAIEKNKFNETDNSEYKEKEKEKESDEKIAFNQDNATELVCPRCGSSLIGSTTFCPGCGLDLKSI